MYNVLRTIKYKYWSGRVFFEPSPGFGMFGI